MKRSTFSNFALITKQKHYLFILSKKHVILRNKQHYILSLVIAKLITSEQQFSSFIICAFVQYNNYCSKYINVLDERLILICVKCIFNNYVYIKIEYEHFRSNNICRFILPANWQRNNRITLYNQTSTTSTCN